MREYKENSTRGKSLILPKRYKKDALVQAWIDRRVLATLSVWLDENGYRTRFMSDVVRIVLEEIANQAVKSGEVYKIEFTEDATKILESKYRVDLNPSGRGLKNLTHNLVLDRMRRRSGVVGSATGVTSVEEDMETRKWVAKAVEIFRQIEEAEERNRKIEQEKRIAENYKVVDGVVVPRSEEEKEAIRGGRKVSVESGGEMERIEREDRELRDMDMSSEAVGLKSGNIVEVEDD